MDIRESLDLMNKYNKCPECGSDKVGNGEGVLDVGDSTFFRSCKCGWEVEVKV